MYPAHRTVAVRDLGGGGWSQSGGLRTLANTTLCHATVLVVPVALVVSVHGDAVLLVCREGETSLAIDDRINKIDKCISVTFSTLSCTLTASHSFNTDLCQVKLHSISPLCTFPKDLFPTCFSSD